MVDHIFHVRNHVLIRANSEGFCAYKCCHLQSLHSQDKSQLAKLNPNSRKPDNKNLESRGIQMASACEKGKKTILKFESEDDVAVALAKYTANLSQRFIKEKGSFNVVLSGGSLIDTMRYLTQAPYKESVDWPKWSIFWLDERVVPLDDKDSNYKLARDGFLSKVSIPDSHIYAINDKKSPEGAAEDYEARHRDLVHRKILPLSDVSGFPKFDLMLVGMGPDGHVASLFPNRPQRYEKKRWVTFITDSPKPPPPRITYTFPVINSSSEIAMVITGADLANAVKDVLENPNSNLPAAEVSPEGLLTWFLDKDAASKL